MGIWCFSKGNTLVIALCIYIYIRLHVYIYTYYKHICDYNESCMVINFIRHSQLHFVTDLGRIWCLNGSFYVIVLDCDKKFLHRVSLMVQRFFLVRSPDEDFTLPKELKSWVMAVFLLWHTEVENFWFQVLNLTSKKNIKKTSQTSPKAKKCGLFIQYNG